MRVLGGTTTTLGRVLFNAILPRESGVCFVNETMSKGSLGDLVLRGVPYETGLSGRPRFLDELKDFGFRLRDDRRDVDRDRRHGHSR